jgi:hypothetical protein
MLRDGLTTDQLLSLPSIARSPALLPNGILDWRYLFNTSSQASDTPQSTSKPEGVMAWIQTNQNIVFAAAGVLLLLAVMGRRR